MFLSSQRFLIILSISTCLYQRTAAELKNVFAHYLVGGMSGVSEATTDVVNAQSVGLDAFALNVQNATASWATDAIQWLFDAAYENDFKLFFSFDMSVFQEPSQFLPLFQKYAANDTYYKHNGLPFVSTFDGGMLNFGQSSPNAGWTTEFRQVLENEGITPFFVPDFDDYGGSAYDAAFFADYTVVDGVFSWEAAWPEQTQGLANVSSQADQTGLTSAHNANKVYMMPLSSVQFKHIDSNQNWYRRGELNLAQRITEVLSVNPDFVEIITWNDAGESHYIGNIWPEAISSSPAIQAYSSGYDHSAWQVVLAPFISAYKNGVTTASGVVPFGEFAGAFWYRALLTSATCPNDTLGKPNGWENAQDAVNVAVLLPADTTGVNITVYSGGNLIATFPGSAGLNSHSVPGLVTGEQKVELVAANGTIMGAGSSTVDVVADTTGTCNFNYQVVHIA